MRQPLTSRQQFWSMEARAASIAAHQLREDGYHREADRRAADAAELASLAFPGRIERTAERIGSPDHRGAAQRRQFLKPPQHQERRPLMFLFFYLVFRLLFWVLFLPFRLAVRHSRQRPRWT